jgi:alginate O-acetyltransferase complex protein AlgJ
VTAPSLLAPLVAAKGTAEVFCRSDTHWTPHGAGVAARAVAEAIGRVAPELPRSTFATTLDEVVHHAGDLSTFVPVASWAARGLVVDEIAVMTTEKVAGDEGAVGLFDVVAAPLALVGTSYSASPLWNFSGALAEASGLEVLNVADEGRGPILPMVDFLASGDFRETPPAVVVWEIPERYLPVPYQARLPVEPHDANASPVR